MSLWEGATPLQHTAWLLQEAVSKTAYAILQHVQAALPEATLYPAVAQARQGTCNFQTSCVPCVFSKPL